MFPLHHSLSETVSDDDPANVRCIIGAEIERLETVQQLDGAQFETIMRAMSATEHTAHLVRTKLTELFKRK